MARKKKTTASTDRTVQIVDRIYEYLKKQLGKPPLYPALRKRVTDLIQEVGDPDEVELVCLTIIDDTHDFSAWKDFNWVFYEYTRDSLEVPSGAWKFALWAYDMHDKKVQESVNYWLGMWYDGESDQDYGEIAKARNALENLWLKHNAAEVDESW